MIDLNNLNWKPIDKPQYPGQRYETVDIGGIDFEALDWQPVKPEATAGRLGGAFVEGLKDIVRTPYQAGYGLTKSVYGEQHPLTRFFKEGARAPVIQPDEEYEGVSSGWTEDFIRAAPQMGSQIVMSMAAGPIAGMAYMGAQIAGGTYENLVKKGVHPDRAITAGVANAVVQAPMEQIGINRLTRMFRIKKPIIQRLKDIAEVAGVEWLTEFLQSYPDAAANIWAENADKTTLEQTRLFLDDIWETTKQGAYEGTLTAPWAVMGAAGGVQRRRPVGPQTFINTVKTKLEDPNDPLTADGVRSLVGSEYVQNTGIQTEIESILAEHEVKDPYDLKNRRAAALKPETKWVTEPPPSYPTEVPPRPPVVPQLLPTEPVQMTPEEEAEILSQPVETIPFTTRSGGELLESIPGWQKVKERPFKPSKVVTEMPIPKPKVPGLSALLAKEELSNQEVAHLKTRIERAGPWADKIKKKLIDLGHMEEEAPPPSEIPTRTPEDAVNFLDWLNLTGGISLADKTHKGVFRDMRFTIAEEGRKRPAKGIPQGLWRRTGKGIDERLLDAIEDGWLPPNATEDDFVTAMQENPTKRLAQVEALEDIDFEEEERYYLNKVEDLKNGEYDESQIEAEERRIQELVRQEAEAHSFTEAEYENLFREPEKEVEKVKEPIKEEVKPEITEKEPTKVKEIQKEPWEMTREEYYENKQLKKKSRSIGTEKSKFYREKDFEEWGERITEKHPTFGMTDKEVLDWVANIRKTAIKNYNKAINNLKKTGKTGEESFMGIVVQTPNEVLSKLKANLEISKKEADRLLKQHKKDKTKLYIENKGWMNPEIIEKHETLIKQALSKGKPVPKEVLAEYPELQEKKEKTKEIKDLSEITVKTTAIREATGEEVVIEQNAKEAVDFVDNQIEALYEIKACLEM